MKYYEKLTKKRRSFIEQLYNLISTQFEEQEKLRNLEPTRIIEELENNSDYIQRIFIDAAWGMGKSFFSKALKEKIEEENKNRETAKKINFININAWETDYFSDPMKSIIGELNNYKLLNYETQTAIEEVMKNVLKTGGKFLLKLVLTKFNLKNEDIEQLKSLFNGVNASELEDYKKYKELIDKFKKCLSLEKDLKVIVIDELDRCKPNYAIELLETIKHFFGVENIIFVFVVNKKQLQSIASTSYLQADECSEYFEKFFDIQFNLPELEYEDFIKIEYNKYNQLQTYGIEEQNIQNGKLSSEDTNKIYEAIFLDAFISNCDSSIVSPRNFIKSFKKFKILFSSLSIYEKSSYPLMIVFILYFIREEFLTKNSNEKIALDRGNNDKIKKISIAELCFKTFFEYFDGEQINKEQLNLNEIINSYQKYTLKDKYIENIWYKILFQVLFFREGEIKSDINKYTVSNYMILIKDVNIYSEPKVEIKINNKEIVFNKIYLGIVTLNFFKTNYEINGCIKIIKNFFSENLLKKYIINKTTYSTTLLEAWAEEKYNFTMNIK